MCFLLMVSLLVQTEAVFACASMDGKVPSHLCLDLNTPACDSRDDCGSGLESASGPCCDVGLARCWVTAEMAGGIDSALAPDPLQLSAPLHAAAQIVQPPADRHSSARQRFDSDWFASTDLYLITRRFRD